MVVHHYSHFDDTRDGKVFSQAATPLGLAIPIYTATAIAGGMPIWNPPNSGVDVELVHVDLASASGTAAWAAVGVMARKLSAIATGEIMTALAATTPYNGLVFRGSSSRVMSSNAGTCTVTAGVAGDWVRTLFGVNGEGAAAGLHGPLQTTYYFNGTLVVPPGTLVYLAATVATVTLYATAVCWKEHLVKV